MHRTTKLITALTICLMAIPTYSERAHRRWPAISPIDVTFSVTDSHPYAETVILGKNGKSLYRVVCHEGDFEDQETGSYDLLFQCKLVPVDPNDQYGDLFIPSAHWNRTRTRATFNSGLNDKCTDHPYYGHKRIFRMRGMRVQLDISNYTEAPSLKELMERDLIKPTSYAFTLRIKADNDPQARNAIAGPAPEVCECDFKLDSKGQVIVTKHLYRDSALNSR